MRGRELGVRWKLDSWKKSLGLTRQVRVVKGSKFVLTRLDMMFFAGLWSKDDHGAETAVATRVRGR